MASIYRVLPKTVCALCQSFDAWIVGSAVGWIDDYFAYTPMELREISDYPNDFDVIVSHENWNKACKILPKDAVINSCGEFKVGDVGNGNPVDVDVWMDDIGNLAIVNNDFHAYHPRTGTFLTTVVD